MSLRTKLIIDFLSGFRQTQGEPPHACGDDQQGKKEEEEHLRPEKHGAHSLEGKLFTVVSTSSINQEMVDMLGTTEEKRRFMTGANPFSAIYGPNAEVLASIEGEDGIIYADIDIEQEIARKQWHDIIGHYNRFDVLSLNLNTDADRPIRFLTSRPPASDSEPSSPDVVAMLLEQTQAEQRELRKAIDSLSGRLDQEGK